MSAHGQLVMPKLGLTMEEGTIAKWQVAPGSRFAAGDIIVVIETDKIANDVEAPAAGVMEEILFAEGTVVPVSEPIARWRLDGGAAAAVGEPVRAVRASNDAPAARSSGVEAPASAIAGQRLQASARILSTPYARRLARDAGLDVASIPGSGPSGRIKADDVLRARAQIQAAAVPAPRDPAPPPAVRAAFDLLAPSDARPADAARALSMAQVEICTQALRDIARRFPGPQAEPARIALIVMACARAFPGSGGTVAVELTTGRGVRALPLPLDGRTSLRDLVVRIIEATREDAGAAVDLASGGAILVVPGGERASLFAPAAPPGWPAALGIGAEREALRRAPSGEIESAHGMVLTLSYDAAAISNAAALSFLSALKDLLEEPLVLLAG